MTEDRQPVAYLVSGDGQQIPVHDFTLALAEPEATPAPHAAWLPPHTVTGTITLSNRATDSWRRQLARIFDVPLWDAGIGRPPSRVANAAYRQRQRNRVKRRRR